jgi:hypothetical protein
VKNADLILGYDEPGVFDEELAGLDSFATHGFRTVP